MGWMTFFYVKNEVKQSMGRNCMEKKQKQKYQILFRPGVCFSFVQSFSFKRFCVTEHDFQPVKKQCKKNYNQELTK